MCISGLQQKMRNKIKATFFKSNFNIFVVLYHVYMHQTCSVHIALDLYIFIRFIYIYVYIYNYFYISNVCLKNKQTIALSIFAVQY